MTTITGLVMIDFINEIMDPKGKLSKKGYPEFAVKKSVGKNVAGLLKIARDKKWLVCHVRVAFSPNYVEHPSRSPLFGAAKQFKALCEEEWGTEFNSISVPLENEPVVRKTRVSAFYSTNLESILRVNGVQRLLVAGVATDLAVQAAVRDAHDRDFDVEVIADCCVAATDADHENSLPMMAKIAKITSAMNVA